jgi:pimeloyl-ACP methyl ester carboxylesterase
MAETPPVRTGEDSGSPPEAPSSLTVIAGGIRTTYLDMGDPQAPPLVLVHDGGYGTDAWSCWQSLIPLLESRFRILAPDQVGHGGTEKVVSFEVDAMSYRVRHLAAFCNALDLERPSLVGSSFGGAVVLNMAARHAVPLSRSVSLCGTGGLFMVAERFAVLQHYEPSLEAAEAIERELVPAPTQEEIRGRYERSLAPGHWEVLSSGRLRNPAAPPPPDWRPTYEAALGSIDIPILLVAGSDDELFEQGWVKRVAALIPGSTTVTVEGAKHQPHRSHARETADLLISFLGGS